MEAKPSLSTDQKTVKVENGETVLLDFQSSAAPQPDKLPLPAKGKLLSDLAQAKDAATRERTANSRKIEIVVFASDNPARDNAAFTSFLSNDSLASLLNAEAINVLVSKQEDLDSLRKEFGIDHYPVITAFNSHMSKIKDFYQLDSADTKAKLMRIVKTTWE